MGDINCDIGDASPGARAWAQPLSGTGYVSIDQVGHGEWGQCPTRVPWGAQSGQERHIDTVVVSVTGMVRYNPWMVSIDTDTELDTPGYGACPAAPGPNCPGQCSCLQHQHSDHKVVVWEVEAKLRPARAKRPDQLRWRLDGLLESKAKQAAYDE